MEPTAATLLTGLRATTLADGQVRFDTFLDARRSDGSLDD